MISGCKFIFLRILRRFSHATNRKPIELFEVQNFPGEPTSTNFKYNFFEKFKLILDVRSPGEYDCDHISGAINIPILDNSERAAVGTIYDKSNPLAAKILGSSLIMKNLSNYLATDGILYNALKSHIKSSDDKILVYCRRGGQRSKSLALVLSEISMNNEPISVLQGGYKAYRKYVIENLNNLSNNIIFVGICGLTGSGKTKILNYLKSQGEVVLDLENLAEHKGSLFGCHLQHIDLSENLNFKMISQKLFDSRLNDVTTNLILNSPHARRSKDNKLIVWVECESRTIGNIHLPLQLWKLIQDSKRIIIDVPKVERIRHIILDYAYWTDDEYLPVTEKVIHWLSKHYDKSLINYWLQLVKNRQFEELVDSLLTRHYDPIYKANRKKYLDCQDESYVVKYGVDSLENEFIETIVCPQLISISKGFFS